MKFVRDPSRFTGVTSIGRRKSKREREMNDIHLLKYNNKPKNKASKNITNKS